MTTTDTSARTVAAPHRTPRPWGRWVLTAFAFPPSGYLATLLVGRVDAPLPALVGGAVTGAGIGAAQGALLRRRGVPVGWVPATAAGLGAGLALGAAAVSYRTDLSSLAVMGAVTGLAVGAAQGAALGGSARTALWSLATAALWPLGWAVTTLAGIPVEEQFTNFGITGALTVAAVQSVLVGALVPDRTGSR